MKIEQLYQIFKSHPEGNWIMEKDEVINGALIVNGNISGKDGKMFDLIVKGDLHCLDLNCYTLKCTNLNFYAIAIAYNSFKCKTWYARRSNCIIKCLDSEVIGKEKKCLLK